MNYRTQIGNTINHGSPWADLNSHFFLFIYIVVNVYLALSQWKWNGLVNWGETELTSRSALGVE